MSFAQSIAYCFSNYFNFNGRASRSEFWWFELFALLLSVVGSVWDASMGDTSGNGMMYWLAVIATFFPIIAVTSRRLHDVNKSGWWQLIVFTIVGIPIYLYWVIIKGTDGNNDFGSSPIAN